MTATSFNYGRKVIWTGEHWTQPPELCPKCNLPPTKDGHDPCIANLKGVTNACCGHGDAQEAYVITSDGNTVRGSETLKEIESIKNNEFEGV